MTRWLLALALFAPLTALATPLEFTHQGRMFDGLGAPMAGSQTVNLKLYDTPSGGTAVWSEDITTDFDNGFFSVRAGQTSALDAAYFDGDTLYMGLALNSGPELTPRIAVVSVPYAITAGNVRGGIVDASEILVGGTTVIDGSGVVNATEIQVNGTTVIDGSGSVAAPVSWDDLTDKPAELTDGDDDLLASLGCSVADEVALVTSAGWQCVDFKTLNIDIDQLPLGTSNNTVAYGDHGHDAASVGALPAGATAADIGALPASTTAADIGALPSSTTAADIGALPASTTAADIGALPSSTTAADIGGVMASGGTFTGDVAVDGGLALGDTSTCDGAAEGTLRWNATSKAVEVCDGTDWRVVTMSGRRDGSDADNAGTDCQDILDNNPGSTNGTYWIDPNDGASIDAFEVYCDMTDDGGGWTKLMSSQWAKFWNATQRDVFNANDPNANNFSQMGRLDDFASGGCFEFRLEVGSTGNWTNDGTRSHYTVWQQCHNPISAATDGSDYTFIEGEESTTCSGFNGLHNRVTQWAWMSDADTTESTGCWWMQIMATNNYNGSGYLEGYGGSGNYHNWQSLWVR